MTMGLHGIVFRLDDQAHLSSPISIENCWLHIRIVGAASAFGSYPHDLLGWIFDVAGFAMNTVLRIYLQTIQAVG